VEPNPIAHDLDQLCATDGEFGRVDGGAGGPVSGGFTANAVNLQTVSGVNQSYFMRIFNQPFERGNEGVLVTEDPRGFRNCNLGPDRIVSINRPELYVQARCGNILSGGNNIWDGFTPNPDELYIVNIRVSIGANLGASAYNTMFWYNALERPDLAVPLPLDAEVPNISPIADAVDGYGQAYQYAKGGHGGTARMRLVGVGSGTPCETPDQYAVARRCDGAPPTILVDPTTNTGGRSHCRYAGDLYRVTGDQYQTGEPVPVVWVDEECPPDSGGGGGGVGGGTNVDPQPGDGGDNFGDPRPSEGDPASSDPNTTAAARRWISTQYGCSGCGG
jgi:hypothetical protein